MEASEPNVSLGSYHSITLELYNQVSIIKEKWYPSQIDRLRDAQMGKSSPVIVIAMDDESALVTQVGSHASKVLLDLDPGIPRKGNDIDGHRRETLAYFNTLATFMRKLREEEIAQYFVIGGPGFTKDGFFEHLKTNFSDLITNVSIVDASSAGQNGVREIILSKIPDNFTAGQSAQNQSKLLQEVLEHLGTSTDKIAYGMNVKIAIGLGAVDKLLILDNKMHMSIETRNEIEELISQNKSMGGRTVLMSSFHDQSSKEILEGLGGIVAILRFPLPK
jgi:protein pelota